MVVAGALLFLQLPIPPTYAGRTIENAGHMPLFFIVTLSLMFVLRDHPRCAGWRLYLVAGLAGMFAGFLSEVIQRPLRRDASWEDVIADCIGALCALAVYALFDRRNTLRRWHRLLAVLVALTCITIYMAPIVTMARAYLYRNGQFPVIASFDSDLELLWTRAVGVRRDITNGTLNVLFVADETPGIAFREPVPDWLSYQTLAIDLENPGSAPLSLGVRLQDWHHNWKFNDRFNRSYQLAAGERRTLLISLDDVRRGPRTRLMDMEQISDITLFRDQNSGSRVLRVHSIRLQ